MMETVGETKDLCDFCGGELQAGVTELELRVEGKRLICENLPAQVCGQCGEAYFTAQVSHQIDDIIARHKELQPLRYETVPVFSPELVYA
jgi:YgiT-type zinc finger domain-containing protein